MAAAACRVERVASHVDDEGEAFAVIRPQHHVFDVGEHALVAKDELAWPYDDVAMTKASPDLHHDGPRRVRVSNAAAQADRVDVPGADLVQVQSLLGYGEALAVGTVQIAVILRLLRPLRVEFQ
jgi:hypothetical protein